MATESNTDTQGSTCTGFVCVTLHAYQQYLGISQMVVSDIFQVPGCLYQYQPTLNVKQASSLYETDVTRQSQDSNLQNLWADALPN